MTMVYNGSITLTSSTLSDGTVDPANNLLYVVETTGPSMRKYNLITLAQVGSSITCLSAPAAICVINSASSVIASTSVTTVDFIENATGYRTNVTGGLALYTGGGLVSQRGAVDTASGIAFFVSSTINKLVQVTASTESVAQITISGIVDTNAASFQPQCIIWKSTGRFLVGGTFGKIYEIDTAGAIRDQLTIPISPNTGLGPILDSYTSANGPPIQHISYDNNILIASTDESIYCYDYSTKTKLWNHSANLNASPAGIVLCASSSGETLVCQNVIMVSNSVVREYNFTTGAPGNSLGSTFFSDSSNKIFCTGFAPGLSIGWALQNTVEKIRTFTVSAPPTAPQVINLPSPYLEGRFVVLDDTGGVGTAKVVLDTYILTGNSYRLPTGKTLIGLTRMYNGVNAFWCESRVNT